MARGRKKLVLDKDEFQKVVDDLEAKNDFQRLAQLWDAVEQTDWAKGQSPRPLTASVAYQRAQSLGITFKTKGGTKGREKLVLDKDEFQKVVDDLEATNEFPKLADLWKAVEKTDWAKAQKPRPLTWSVAHQRAQDLGITHKTKGATKGRAKLVIDKDEFQQVVNDVESSQEFEKLSDLWAAVEQTEWAKKQEPRPLTASVASQRAQDLEITHKTKAKRRKRQESDSQERLEDNKFYRPDPVNFGVPHPRGMLFVVAPAGSCPHRLSDTHEDAVVDWATKVVKTCIEEDRLISPSALFQFSRQFYETFSDECALVKEHIQNNKDVIYQAVGGTVSTEDEE